MKLPVILVALLVAGGPALAQPGEKQDGKQKQMSQEQRQRMRDDMREVYRDRQGRPERQRQMSPQERDKLRRDIQDANRELKR